MASLRSGAPSWLAAFAEHVVAKSETEGWRAPLLIRVSDALGSAWEAELPNGSTRAVVPPDSRPLRIASVTKVYVAAALLRLIEEGKLALTAVLADIVDPATSGLLSSAGYDPLAMTLDQIMRHTAGLRDHCSSVPFLDALVAGPRHRWTRHEQVAIAMRLGPPLGSPGAAFAYSDTGYVILGEVIERAHRATLDEALSDLLGFNRLGLAQTRFDASGAAPGMLQEQYFGEAAASGFDASFDLFGGGGLISTLTELDGFYRALFGGGVFAKSESLAELFAAPLTPSDYPRYFHNGLMFRATIHGLDVWAHTGFWGLQAAYLPGRDLMLAASFNRSPQPGAYDKDDLLEDLAAFAAGRHPSL